jgi:hypothetical protein
MEMLYLKCCAEGIRTLQFAGRDTSPTRLLSNIRTLLFSRRLPTLGCFHSAALWPHSVGRLAVLHDSECPPVDISTTLERGRPPSSISIAPPARRNHMPSSISAASRLWPSPPHGQPSPPEQWQLTPDPSQPSPLDQSRRALHGELHTPTSLHSQVARRCCAEKSACCKHMFQRYNCKCFISVLQK